MRGSRKATAFTESVIREMTRLAQLHGAVNLAQGFPDFPAPSIIKDAAAAAIRDDINQYAVTWGAKPLRDAIAKSWTRRYGQSVDPDTQVTVCCGSTEAMIATMLAIVDPGDEVVVFEPFYENYGPDAILSGAQPRYVRLHEPDWHIDPSELAEAFNDRTRAVIINTPNNPTGKVFTIRRAAAHRESVPSVGRHCHHRRNLRAHPVRRSPARADGDARGHGGSHGDDQQPVEDVQRHGLAGGLDDLAAGAFGRHPEGP